MSNLETITVTIRAGTYQNRIGEARKAAGRNRWHVKIEGVERELVYDSTELDTTSGKELRWQ